MVASAPGQAVDENSPLCPKVYEHKDPESDSLQSESGGLPKLQRSIGIFSASAILFGNCVGAGIFISPKGVYEQTGSAGAGLLIWVLAGFMAILCTYCYSELGTMIEESGGEFSYIHRALGRWPSFLYSFCYSFVVRPAGLAVVVVTLADYTTTAIWGPGQVGVWMMRAIGLSVLLLMGCLNVLSVKLVIRLCSALSATKLVVIGALLVAGITVMIKGNGHVENFESSFEGSSKNPVNYGMAFYYALYAHQGWNSLNFMVEELKNPKKTLPVAGFLGMGLVMISYALANVSYLMMFGIPLLITSNTIAMDCGYVAFGKIGRGAMCVGIILSCLGCVTGGILASARNVQSTARKGVFPQCLDYVHPTFQTPLPAVIISTFMCGFYTLFDVSMLIPCLCSVEWLWYTVTFGVLLKLRWTDPKAERPIKVFIVIPILMLLIAFAFVILPLFDAKTRVSVGVGMSSLVLGTAIYGVMEMFNSVFGSKRQKKQSTSSSDSAYSDL